MQQVRRAKSRSKLQSQVLHDNRLCSLEEKRAEITERALYSFAKHFPGHFWTFQMDGRAARAHSFALRQFAVGTHARRRNSI